MEKATAGKKQQIAFSHQLSASSGFPHPTLSLRERARVRVSWVLIADGFFAICLVECGSSVHEEDLACHHIAVGRAKIDNRAHQILGIEPLF